MKVLVLAVTVFAMTTHAVVVVTIADAVIYEDDWSGDDSGDEESDGSGIPIVH